MLRRCFVSGFIGRIVLCSLLTSWAVAQSSGPNPSAQKALTIEAIFAEGGITGRPPETIQWMPDNTNFTFIQRDDSGEHGELWSVDVNSAAKTLLVSQSKLATLAPSFGVRERNEHRHEVRQHGERPRFVLQGQGTNHIHYVITLSNIP